MLGAILTYVAIGLWAWTGVGGSAGADRLLSNLSNVATALDNIGLGTTDSPTFAGLSLSGGDLQLVDEVALSDAAASPTVAGRLRRNGANIEWHDGTAARVMYRAAGTNVAISDGGTGADDAAGARAALGVAIGSDVQSYDATTAALASLAWTAGTQVPSFTGADVAGLLTVGSGANELVQRDALGRLTGDGSQLTGISGGDTASWDWTTAAAVVATDQTRAAMDAGDWVDASTVGGDQALTSLATSEGGQVLVLDTVAGTSQVQGALVATPAADFVVVIRFGLAIRGVNIMALSTTATAHAVYVDGANVDTVNWYGAGVRYGAADYEAHSFGGAEGLTIGDYWDTLSVGSEATWWRATMYDVWLERVGATLTAYAAPAGGAPLQVQSWTVTANAAGYVGIRVLSDSLGHDHHPLVTSLRWVDNVPGF